MRLTYAVSILLGAASLSLTGCGGGGGGGGGSAAHFVTADLRGMAGGGALPGAGVGANGDTPVQAPGATANEAAGDVAREIEESDVARVDGDLLVLVNAWRGLALVDLSTVTVVGRLPLDGIPAELHLLAGRAVVLAGANDGSTNVLEVSLATPASPSLLATAPIAGAYRTSRLVGTTLHVVTDRRVASFGLSPSLTSIGSVALPESAAFVAASDSLLAISGYGDGTATAFSLVSVSGAAAPVVRSTFTRPGWVADDKKLDLAGSVLRIVTHDAADGGLSHVFTVSVASPSSPSPLGSLDLARGEQTFATCFDGTRVYIVTFERVDPLWIVDLSNPVAPSLAGSLTVPGWSTQIVPTGDGRLVALGTDPAAGFATVVSLFDVSNPVAPTILDREEFPGGWSPAGFERKAFGVFPTEGLVTVPLTGLDDELAVVNLGPTGLSRRGSVPMSGAVLRGFPHSRGLVGVSAEEVVVTDLATLAVKGRAVIAENVVDAVTLPDGRVISLVASRHTGRLGDTTIDLSPERLFAVGAHVAVVGWDDLGRGAYVVDFTGVAPTVSTRFDLGSTWFVLGDPTWAEFGPVANDARWIGGGGATGDARLTPDGKLVVHGIGGSGPPVPSPLPNQKPPPLGVGDGVLDGFIVLDIVNARLDAPVDVTTGYVSGFALDGAGGLLYTVGGEAAPDGEGRPRMRHDLVRVDLSTRATTGPVNVPGYVLAARGGLVFTAEERWTSGWSTKCAVVASRLDPSGVSETGRLDLPDGSYDLRAVGPTLWFTSWATAGLGTGGAGGLGNGVAFAPDLDLPDLLPSSSIRTIRLADVPTFGPSIVSDRFLSLLLPEEGGALVVEDGTTLVRYDVTGATATTIWTRALSTWPLLARPDPVHGGWLVPLGYAGLLTVP